MSSKTDSSLLSRVIVAIIVILGSAGFYSILWQIWEGEVLSIWERIMGVITAIVAMAAIVYVLIQRIKMRETETFRREKW
jgi:hypothetical protein